jgi:hypothetical protein
MVLVLLIPRSQLVNGLYRRHSQATAAAEKPAEEKSVAELTQSSLFGVGTTASRRAARFHQEGQEGAYRVIPCCRQVTYQHGARKGQGHRDCPWPSKSPGVRRIREVAEAGRACDQRRQMTRPSS